MYDMSDKMLMPEVLGTSTLPYLTLPYLSFLKVK